MKCIMVNSALTSRQSFHTYGIDYSDKAPEKETEKKNQVKATSNSYTVQQKRDCHTATGF